MYPVSDGRADRPTIAPLVMKWLVFSAAAGVVVYLCLLILRPFFDVVAWSTVLAITCYPFHQRLVRRNGRVALSAATTSVLMVLAVLVPLVFIGGVAVNQLLTLRDSLRQVFLDPDGMSRRVTAALAPLTHSGWAWTPTRSWHGRARTPASGSLAPGNTPCPLRQALAVQLCRLP